MCAETTSSAGGREPFPRRFRSARQSPTRSCTARPSQTSPSMVYGGGLLEETRCGTKCRDRYKAFRRPFRAAIDKRLTATSASLSLTTWPKGPAVFRVVGRRQSCCAPSTPLSFVWMNFCYIINSIYLYAPARRIRGSCRSGPASLVPTPTAPGRARLLGSGSLRKPPDSPWAQLPDRLARPAP